MSWQPRIRLGLLVVAAVVLQTTVFSAGLRVFGVGPDLGLVLTVAVAFSLGPERGAVFGFVAGLDWEAVVEGLAALTSVPGRLEPVPCDRGYEVLVDYAHSPDALRRVILGEDEGTLVHV